MSSTVQLELEGMTCAACAARIEKKLNRVDGVEASVNFATERATVRCDDEVPVETLIAAVRSAGYDAHAHDAGAHHHHDERLREIADRVLWLEDGRFKELAGLVTDPVCGMRLDPGEAVTLEWEGERFYFCAAGCREQFEREHMDHSDTLVGYHEEGAKHE